VLAIGMHTTNLAAFLLAGIGAGIGAGMLFKSAAGAVAAMAEPAKRSEALAGLFLISYLGLALPAIGLGLATRYTTTTTAMTWFTGILLALLAVVGMLDRRPSTPPGQPG
jgi:MFS family permease